MSATPDSENRAWRRGYLWLLLLALCAYGYHVWVCSQAPLFYFPYVFEDSDMKANLLWAQSILEQGWTNPSPHHPYNGWMPAIGTRAEWLHWWNGPQIFQQSPLYAYIMAGFLAFSSDLIYLHIAQALAAVLLCAMIGWTTYAITEKRAAGVAGFIVSVLYAPFYVYSWTPLRDFVGWVVTAALLVALLKLNTAVKQSRQTLWLGFGTGLSLGLGFLVRENYSLVIPIVCAATLLLLWKDGKKVWLVLCLGIVIPIVPLVIRNHQVGAPLLSTSNRFAEVFIHGNAASAEPYQYMIPDEMGTILRKSDGKPWPLVKETLATHPSAWSWIRRQLLKVLSLLDPTESPDNTSIAYMEGISPLVKWGLKHWMLIVPGICGAVLSICRRDMRHWPLWLLLVPLFASVLIGLPLSRYRQGLMILWIPWAVYFVLYLTAYVQERRWKPALAMAGCFVAGWLLSLGPLARFPKSSYDRPLEYALTVRVYDKLKQPEEARKLKEWMRAKYANHPDFYEWWQHWSAAAEGRR